MQTMREERSWAGVGQCATLATNETLEVARLLAEAGVDRTGSLWAQMLELASERAADWTERSQDARSPLNPALAAIWGLRSVAGSILSMAEEAESEREVAAAEACLRTCADAESRLSVAPDDLPERRRRWGEGATPGVQRRPVLPGVAVGSA